MNWPSTEEGRGGEGRGCVVWSYSMYAYAVPCWRLISRLILTEKINVVDHSLTCPSLGRNLTNECNYRDLAIRGFVPADKLKWTCWVCGMVAGVVDYLVYITQFRFAPEVSQTIRDTQCDTFSTTKTIQLFWVMWPLILWHQRTHLSLIFSVSGQCLYFSKVRSNSGKVTFLIFKFCLFFYFGPRMECFN